MVARVRPDSKPLLVTFSRDGEEPEQVIARDPANAWEHGVHLISKRRELLHGDTLTVLRAED